MGQSGVTHSFTERLAWGERDSDEAFWTSVYKKAFPGMVTHALASGDVPTQRMGIDRLVLLSNGRTLYIDEKKRAREYPDILLEYVSVDTTGAPGWMEKDLAIDYLAYAFMQSGRCYLFSWPLLRRTWFNYREKWLLQYPIIKAKNDGYNTLSVAIPTELLRRAVSAAALLQVDV